MLNYVRIDSSASSKNEVVRIARNIPKSTGQIERFGSRHFDSQVAPFSSRLVSNGHFKAYGISKPYGNNEIMYFCSH